MRDRQHRTALFLLAMAAGAASSLGPTPARAHAAPTTLAAVLATQPEGLVPPELLNSVTVEYPPALAEQEAPPAGQVVVKLTIGTDGVPKDLSVETSIDPELDRLAVEGVAQLRWKPATLNGDPVEIVTRLGIDFTPPPPPEPEPEPPPVEPDPAEPVVDAPPDEPDPVPETPDADGPVRMKGVILEAGQRTPISGATIVVVPADPDAKLGEIKKKDYAAEKEPAWQAQASSDEEGRFEVRGTGSGKARVIILAPGYERIEFVEALYEGMEIDVKYYVSRSPTNPFRTVVEVENRREEVAKRTISAAEINVLPGTQGDALKAVQNFPGVARAPFGAGLLAIRGTGPNDSAVYLGYHEIPTLFHFGGLTSVFNSDIIERIDFIPGNYDSRYGDAIGGIIDVEPRQGRRDGFHGYVDSDIFDTGILFEGPIGEGSFAVSGRRSYIDFLLPVFLPDDAGLDLTVAPRYYDYQVLFDYPLGGGNLSIRGFGSDDRTRLVAANPNDVEPDERNRFETSQYFHRADIVYTKRDGPWSFLVTPSYRYDFFDLGIGDFLSFDLVTHNLNGRAEARAQLTKRHAITFGTEFQSYFFQVGVKAPPLPDSNGGSSNAVFDIDVDGYTAIPALYTTGEIGVSDDFTFYPGVRIAYYSSPFQTATFDPRLRFGWQLADRTVLKGGSGIYSQAPQPVEASNEFGNPRVGPERAVQNSLGISQTFDYGIEVDATAFYNYLWDNISESAETVERPDGTIGPENFANSRIGRVYGLEILARKQLTGNVFGWIAYTLSRSERRDTPSDEFRVFDLDQTHILTLIGSYKLPKNWTVGARFRLVSGNPNTPVVGSQYDASGGFYIPINGAINSERFPTFHQLDIRVDKAWIWKLASLTLYLDVQNVYNAQNVEFWNYSFDFTQRSEIASLPIIPSIGTKIEF
ncbi:MAG: energy transducer TonB [Myxococcota bacterium]